MCWTCVDFVDQDVCPGLVTCRLKMLPSWSEFFVVVFNAKRNIALAFVVWAEETAMPI
jgi:hypothetical protein